MAKTMKAAQFHPDTMKIHLETIPIPEPKDDEILVKTISSGLCHSDLMVLDGSLPIQSTIPVTIGHEAVGRIVSLGRSVTGDFSVGNIIGFLNAHHACWDCAGCARHYAHCTSGNFKMQGWALDGFMQEYCIVDHRTAFVLPEKLDPRKAAPLTCAGITAFNAVRKAGVGKEKGDQGWLGVVGCGGLGQLALRYAKALNLNVIAIDIDDSILAHAQAAGVQHTFNSRTNPDFVTSLKQITGSANGVDAAAVFTAVTAGYDVGLSILRPGGRLVCVGCPGEDIKISAMSVALGVYSVVGANNMARPRELRECAEFTAEHGVDPPIKTFKIEQIEEMVEMMEGGRLGGNRLVVQYDD